MAVAKALGARRILAIDVQQQRLEFAKKYAATDIHVALPKEQGEDNMTYSKRHVSAPNQGNLHEQLSYYNKKYRVKQSWRSLALENVVKVLI